MKPEKYDEVIRGYDKSIKIDANNAEAYNNKGVILYSWANVCHDKATELDPNYDDYTYFY